MAGKQHRYRPIVAWTGNTGEGTTSYKGYERAHAITAQGKAEIAGSSDASFRGDAGRWNPEELFVASASTCHMLWYLHLCATNGVVVLDYRDEPEGLMIEEADGSGAFARIVLRPQVKLSATSSEEKARELHHKAHEMCFIANSVKCEISTEPSFSR
ncbi:OsmC family protein [Bradyrhizobium sp. LHD-71]|uniref:OsmC family protein n=1 Tax=Bradyrhizobium sp. LHD-71 TaxID=3072141 RepID=UPI00280DBA7D|nr:OsmC family protein [Bradyrhizobium sp. LHD-71]MDQ8726404.1 OsmC family protein [Bradyrhizobium sp. LHD-71]